MSDLVTRGEDRCSDDGVYRYLLTRRWDPNTALPTAVFVMLHPTPAAGDADDPVIRRCVWYAQRWGCGGLHLLNLYAFRATTRHDLWAAEDPVGPLNDLYLTRSAVVAGRIGWPLVAAWGAHAHTDRVEHVLGLPGMERVQALGVNKDGSPTHPTHTDRDAALTPWPVVRVAP